MVCCSCLTVPILKVITVYSHIKLPRSGSDSHQYLMRNFISVNIITVSIWAQRSENMPSEHGRPRWGPSQSDQGLRSPLTKHLTLYRMHQWKATARIREFVHAQDLYKSVHLRVYLFAWHSPFYAKVKSLYSDLYHYIRAYMDGKSKLAYSMCRSVEWTSVCQQASYMYKVRTLSMWINQMQ